jgi:hypothetical protein
MSRVESGAPVGQESFSLDGQLIGGPKEFWKRITNDEVQIRGAWEFTNQREQNGQLNGYKFQFPRGARIDIYVEDSSEQKVFTAMGGQGANLDPRWKVTGIQLYINSRKWEEQHEGQWMELKNNGTTLSPTNEWLPVGTTPPKRIEPPFYAPTPDAPPVNYSWTGRDKQNANRALKWALAGVLALGGIGALSSILKSTPEPQTTPIPTPTEGPYQYEKEYSVRGFFPDCHIIACYGIEDSIVVVNPGSDIGIVTRAFSNPEVQLHVDTNTKLIFIVTSPLIGITVPDDTNLQENVVVQYNVTGDIKHLAKDDAASQSNINSIIFDYDTYPNYVSLESLCTTPGLSCTTP